MDPEKDESVSILEDALRTAEAKIAKLETEREQLITNYNVSEDLNRSKGATLVKLESMNVRITNEARALRKEVKEQTERTNNHQQETWEQRRERELEERRLRTIEENKDRCPIPIGSNYGNKFVPCREEACKWYVKHRKQCAIVVLTDIYVSFDGD